MAATDLDICNLALDIVSVTNKVASIAVPTTKEEYACQRWYATVRDLVLRRFPWPFAKRSAELVAIPSTTETHLEWPYLYEAPSTLLKARRIFIEGQARNARTRMPFQMFLNAAGTAYIIGADSEGISLEYTRKFDTNVLVALMPASFVDAFAAKLAARLVKPLSLDAALIKEAEGLYLMSVNEAFGDNAEEQQFDEQPDAAWITVRE